MGHRKVIDGVKAGGRGLQGSQTTSRRLTQQFNLHGGLNNNSDITTQSPSEWLNCTNARMPILGTNYVGGIVNTKIPRSMFYFPSYSVNSTLNLVQYNMIPAQTCLGNLSNAKAYPSTVWPFESFYASPTGTVSFTNQGASLDQSSVNLSATSGVLVQAVFAVPPKDISSILASQPYLALDMANLTGYTSGNIIIGTDASNNYQFNFTQTDTSGNFIPIKFDFRTPSATSGTPDLTNIKYIEVQFLSGSNTMNISFRFLRLANFESAITGDFNFGVVTSNIQQCFPYTKTVSSGGQPQNIGNPPTALMLVNNGNLYQTFNSIIGSSSDYNLACSLPYSGFSKSGYFQSAIYSNGTNQNQNVLYFVNGADGYFSYDGNASITSQLTQISTTAYKYIAVYGGSSGSYIWVAGDPANPNTLVPTLLGTPGSLDLSNAITLPNNDGQSYITGLLDMDTYLIIFRNRDIWLLSGSVTGVLNNLSLQKTMATVGAISQQCVARMGPYAYFYNGRGVYSFNGTNEVLISEKLNFKINGVAVNPASVSLSYNIPEEALYVMVGPDNPATVNPIPQSDYASCGAYIYNPGEKIWTFIGGTSDPTSVYFGGFSFTSPIDNQTYWYTFGLYLLSQVVYPSAFPATYNQNFLVQSAWNNLGEPFIQKDPAQVRLFVGTSYANVSGTLNFYSDFNNTPIFSTTFIVPNNSNSNSGYVDVSVGPGCQGHAFSVEIDIPNTIYQQSNTVYSGYALSWTEAEVI